MLHSINARKRWNILGESPVNDQSCDKVHYPAGTVTDSNGVVSSSSGDPYLGCSIKPSLGQKSDRSTVYRNIIKS